MVLHMIRPNVPIVKAQRRGNGRFSGFVAQLPVQMNSEKKSYKTTLNLPQTAFAMEAKLVANEPLRLKKWQEMDLYAQIQSSRKDAPKFVLHDGPPFANGDIHMGHLTNKTLKDVILRYKTLAGFATPYVPGWDCHGLPIEHKVQQDLGKAFREMPPVEVRKKCFEYADKYAGIQSEQFQRLGILGDWANPYLTMKPAYEANTLEVFAQVVENGLVYKQLKTVPWSIANQTALADAELEYQDVTDQTVFVEFPVANPGAFKAKFDLRVNAKVSFLIWTTTPWTLPANLAIAVHQDVEYALVKYQRNGDTHISVIARDLVEKVMSKSRQWTVGSEQETGNGSQEKSATTNHEPRITNHEVLKTVKGSDLDQIEYLHPFIERTSKIVMADYVTTTDGTGLVHTAPGHGEDDYNTGVTHGLEIYCPVLPNGRFDSTVPNWLAGLSTKEGNTKVIEKLAELDVLFAQEAYLHSYPHDWRSKTPIIFRATEQWFVSLDKKSEMASSSHSLRENALETVKNKVSFVPDWGRARMNGMLQSRPDWCISRQRSWGLPIPVFYNEQNQPLLTPESVRAVAKVFGQVGSDAWFTHSPEQLLEGCDTGPDFPKDKLRKEKDIFDVWFESGSSWMGVLKAREPTLHFPADLYLEGSDQHRGWFQLSLLPALASVGEPPFKQVLTHGFIVGPDGKKISKSDKNYVKAVDEVNRHGADLLRLFVCQLDFEGDMAASPKMIQEFGDKYRKLRNTLRYLLSNLYDYDGASFDVPGDSLDGWMLAELDGLIVEVTHAYESYTLHKAFRALHEFCAVQISSIYGNAMKDRLYCDAPDSLLRRRSQYVMHQMLLALTKLLSPMIVFTADETWEHIPHKPADEADLPSVHLAKLPLAVNHPKSQAWNTLFDLRENALMQLDKLKKEKGLNKAIEAELVLPGKLKAQLANYGVDLEDMVGCGFHRFDDGIDTVTVLDAREKYPACARSWKRRPDVGSDPDYPDLSARDAAAVKAKSM